MFGYELKDYLVFLVLFILLVFLILKIVIGWIKRISTGGCFNNKLYCFKIDGVYRNIYIIFYNIFLIYQDYKWKLVFPDDTNTEASLGGFIEFLSALQGGKKVLYIVLIVNSIVLAIDAIFAICFRSLIYKEGILIRNGKFIPWDGIKSITYKDTFIGSSKSIKIYTSEKKYETVFVKKADIDIVLNIFFENTNVDVYEVEESYEG